MNTDAADNETRHKQIDDVTAALRESADNPNAIGFIAITFEKEGDGVLYKMQAPMTERTIRDMLMMVLNDLINDAVAEQHNVQQHH